MKFIIKKFYDGIYFSTELKKTVTNKGINLNQKNLCVYLRKN